MTVEVHARASELLKQMANGNLYRKAYEDGMPLSTWLEREDPSEERDTLDAFGRMMKVAGIKTQSDPANGYYADRFEAFDANDNTRALVPEWMRRVWLRATHPTRYERSAVYGAGDFAVGTIANPYVDAATPRQNQIAPAIPLSEVITITTPIDSDHYRAFYLTTPNAADIRMSRVVEGAELPHFKLTGGEHTIDLHKYGGVLEVTYEQLRRQRIDMVALHLARIAVQAETDKVADAIDVIVNGDGNANTAATNSNLTTLDSGATAGTLTLKAWLAWKLLFANPYALTTAFARSDVALQMMMLNVGSANVPLVAVQGASGFGSFTAINPQLRDNVALGITSDAPSLKIVGIDRRFALEYVTEIGSDISEVERWATRQTQMITMSEVDGFAVLEPSALRTLNVNA